MCVSTWVTRVSVFWGMTDAAFGHAHPAGSQDSFWARFSSFGGRTLSVQQLNNKLVMVSPCVSVTQASDRSPDRIQTPSRSSEGLKLKANKGCHRRSGPKRALSEGTYVQSVPLTTASLLLGSGAFELEVKRQQLATSRWQSSSEWSGVVASEHFRKQIN